MPRVSQLARFLGAACASAFLTSCARGAASAEQRASVKALLSTSEQCVYDVRDRGMKYESSQNCNALGALSLQYVSAGGGSSGAPLETEIEFERARVQAWMALALSASDGRASRIW